MRREIAIRLLHARRTQKEGAAAKNLRQPPSLIALYGARHHKLTVYKVYKNLMVPGTINFIPRKALLRHRKCH